jgi:hydroxyethylthiazole kinase-like uncharacterized protein yjeF
MEAAGAAVAEATARLAPAGSRVAVLAGPGNNGGDGLVAARCLAEAGYRPTVALLGPRARLKGDAALAAAAWRGAMAELTPGAVQDADVVVDALFGTGLDRPLEGVAAAAIDAANRSGRPIVAVDIPSGIDGTTGQVLGTAVEATETVTFFRLKPGLLLQPGRMHAGRITVADIGIDAATLATIGPTIAHNRPGLWSLPPLVPLMHKYNRGHTVVVSGAASRTGAARLAARGALRVGSGLVTVASPPDALAVNAAHLTAIMLLPMDGPKGLAAILADRRKNAVVLGPALGVGPETAAVATAALASSAAVVLDADALTSFAGANADLAEAIAAREAPVVLTPHEGEFARLFPDLAGLASKVDRARQAARLSGAVVVLKGPDTVVAAPDGRAAIADNAPPHLATAGSGDVLSGMIGGLLAEGLAAFEAAAAAVFLHGEAGRIAGRGMIAEDLPEALPAVFTALDGQRR